MMYRNPAAQTVAGLLSQVLQQVRDRAIVLAFLTLGSGLLTAASREGHGGQRIVPAPTPPHAG